MEEKLDLQEFLKEFKSFFAREKTISLDIDVNYLYKLIEEFSKFNIKELPKVKSLDDELSRLFKGGYLNSIEIFEFVKIIKYFLYLKRFNISYLDKIDIPKDIIDILDNFEDGKIKEEVSEDLININNSINKAKENIKYNLISFINSNKLNPYLVDKQIHYVNSIECLLLRPGFNHVLKGKIINRSSSGFFYVVPNKIRELYIKLDDLNSIKQEIIYSLEKEYSNILSKWHKFLTFINKEFDKVDNIVARIFFARAKDLNFILPKKTDKARLIDFYHPSIKNPKPISVNFSKNIIIITGVNAGGKTMLLKSILSSCFLSKYLIPYKANKKSIIPTFKHIIPILDDPQNVKQDISTFAGRMVEFANLFKKDNAIVGVDEIELGTDSNEASSLFKVLVEELVKKNIKLIVTTHHKRLASLLVKNNETLLIAALYDEKSQRPKYEFLEGTIGKSYAFDTALRYKIPPYIVKMAKENYNSEIDNLDNLISKTAELEFEYKQKLQELNKKLEEVDILKKSIKDKEEKLIKEFENSKENLEKEYFYAIKEAKEAVKKANKKEIQRFLNKAHLKKQSIKTKEIKKDFKVGDIVKYGSIKGEIVAIKNNIATILTETMKLEVKLSKLEKSVCVKKKEKVSIPSVKKASISLDLHGLRRDEAIEKLDKFINNSLLAGFDELLVYHGIGSGILSKAVSEFLKNHPRVLSFSDAPANMGGYGAKIIKI